MKVLLQYLEFSKVRELSCFSELNDLVQDTFKLEPSSYFLQKFDRDFDEFTDLEDISSIADKDKIKIICIQRPQNPDLQPAEDVINSLTFSSLPEQAFPETVQDVVVLPLHLKQWPENINLPFQDFSKSLIEDLTAERNLSWDSTRELVGHLANYAYSFKPYPNKTERLSICYALMMKYPHLKNNIGNGIEGWEIKLLNKLKRLRQGDNSLEIKLNRQMSHITGRKTPKNIAINPKKGELNWSPDHLQGETTESLQLNKTLLAEEYSKSEKLQDKGKISALMSITYSFRRALINNKVPVADLKLEYPIFFQPYEQFEEFHRLTSVFIKDQFFKESEIQGPVLYQIFSNKKKSTEELSLLCNFKKDCQDMDLQKKIEAQTAFGFLILPYLLKEKIDDFFKIVSDDDCTPDCEKSYPIIYSTTQSITGTFWIVCEGIELNRSTSFLQIVCLLISYYYTMNIQYPKLNLNSLQFLQNSILKIRGGSVCPKVKTLINKIKVIHDKC